MPDQLGTVYVFNVFSEQLTLSVNGINIASGAIAGWFGDNQGPKYRPNVGAVPRTLNASDSPGKFWNGKNALTIQWADGLFMAQVEVDGGQFPMIQDILLFITKNRWRLVNQEGVERASGDVTAAGDIHALSQPSEVDAQIELSLTLFADFGDRPLPLVRLGALHIPVQAAPDWWS